MASFHGRETYSIDHKGRVSVPATMRRDATKKRPITTFFVTRGFDGCIALFPPDEWDKVEERLREVPMGDPDGRAFERAFRKDVYQVTVDGQGRITIPPPLISRAGLSKDAVLHGMGNRIEIWNPERYDQVTGEAEAEGTYEKLAAKVMGGRKS